VTVSANASDTVGVVGVQFKLDGANLGAEATSAPYSVTWNTTTMANGSHTLSAVARDAAGNQAWRPASRSWSTTRPLHPPLSGLTFAADSGTIQRAFHRRERNPLSDRV